MNDFGKLCEMKIEYEMLIPNKQKAVSRCMLPASLQRLEIHDNRVYLKAGYLKLIEAIIGAKVRGDIHIRYFCLTGRRAAYFAYSEPVINVEIGLEIGVDEEQERRIEGDDRTFGINHGD